MSIFHWLQILKSLVSSVHDGYNFLFKYNYCINERSNLPALRWKVMSTTVEWWLWQAFKLLRNKRLGTRYTQQPWKLRSHFLFKQLLPPFLHFHLHPLNSLPHLIFSAGIAFFQFPIIILFIFFVLFLIKISSFYDFQ